MARKCFECGKNANVQHHVVPRSRGGTKTVDLCEPCHGKAHGRKMKTRQLTIDALRQKKQRGERTGTVPYGYGLASNGIDLVPIVSEQAGLMLIVRMRVEGKTLRQIAEELTAGGFVTKNGKPWSHSTIQGILERAA